MTKIISIHSYRGGTGKSNFTANLAAALAIKGQRVAVVDTDLQSPGIHILFNLEENTISKTLNDYLWGRCAIENAAYDVTATLGPTASGCLFLIPASLSANEISRILSEGYDVSLLNDGFRQAIQKLQLDYLLIDTHPGLSRETLLSIAISHLVLLILRPDQQDYLGTAVTTDVARQLKVRKMMLVLNKVLERMDFAKLQQKVESTYDLPVAGVFPLSEDMIQLGSHGLFFVEYPNHPFSQALGQVAAQL